MHVDPRTRVSLLSRPKRLRSSVRIKWRVDIDKIDAGCGEFAQLIQIITAVDDARVDERGRLCRHFFRLCRKLDFWSTRHQCFGARTVAVSVASLRVAIR